MNTIQLAAKLNGREYGEEITREEEMEAKASSLVILFGASDDLAEFRGAINDECGAGDQPILISQKGLIDTPDDDEERTLKKFGVLHLVSQSAKSITPIWCKGDYSWQYETSIPHATFDVMEGSEKYCRGIVFELEDLK